MSLYIRERFHDRGKRFQSVSGKLKTKRIFFSVIIERDTIVFKNKIRNKLTVKNFSCDPSTRLPDSSFFILQFSLADGNSQNMPDSCPIIFSATKYQSRNC